MIKPLDERQKERENHLHLTRYTQDQKPKTTRRKTTRRKTTRQKTKDE